MMILEPACDPYGIAFWPNFPGRDGCRTPMPWDDSEHGGFSAVTPWLPVPHAHRALCVAHQSADRRSTLNAVRAFLRWRKGHPALLWGGIRFLDVPEPLLAFVRSHGDSQILAVFHLSDREVRAELPDRGPVQQIESVGVAQRRLDGGRLQLPEHGVIFASLKG